MKIRDKNDDGLRRCPECQGAGHCEKLSNCCDARFAGIGWPENDICSDCGEHADLQPCDECDGTGKIRLYEDQTKKP